MKEARKILSLMFITILILGGLGLGSYFLVINRIRDSEERLVVGEWNNVNKNTENNLAHNEDYNFLLGWSDLEEVNSSYVNLINQSKFNLLMPGLYKISLVVIFSEIVGAATYSMRLLINGNSEIILDRFASAYGSSITYISITSIYLSYEDGNLNLEIFAISETDDPFTVDTTNEKNQLTIEYVIQ